MTRRPEFCKALLDAERYRRLRLRGCYVDEYRNQYTEELDAICDALPPSDSARPTSKRKTP